MLKHSISDKLFFINFLKIDSFYIFAFVVHKARIFQMITGTETLVNTQCLLMSSRKLDCSQFLMVFSKKKKKKKTRNFQRFDNNDSHLSMSFFMDWLVGWLFWA